jgi:hypothetical protein
MEEQYKFLHGSPALTVLAALVLCAGEEDFDKLFPDQPTEGNIFVAQNANDDLCPLIPRRDLIRQLVASVFIAEAKRRPDWNLFPEAVALAVNVHFDKNGKRQSLPNYIRSWLQADAYKPLELVMQHVDYDYQPDDFGRAYKVIQKGFLNAARMVEVAKRTLPDGVLQAISFPYAIMVMMRMNPVLADVAPRDSSLGGEMAATGKRPQVDNLDQAYRQCGRAQHLLKEENVGFSALGVLLQALLKVPPAVTEELTNLSPTQAPPPAMELDCHVPSFYWEARLLWPFNNWPLEVPPAGKDPVMVRQLTTSAMHDYLHVQLYAGWLRYVGLTEPEVWERMSCMNVAYKGISEPRDWPQIGNNLHERLDQCLKGFRDEIPYEPLTPADEHWAKFPDYPFYPSGEQQEWSKELEQFPWNVKEWLGDSNVTTSSKDRMLIFYRSLRDGNIAPNEEDTFWVQLFKLLPKDFADKLPQMEKTRDILIDMYMTDLPTALLEPLRTLLSTAQLSEGPQPQETAGSLPMVGMEDEVPSGERGGDNPPPSDNPLDGGEEKLPPTLESMDTEDPEPALQASASDEPAGDSEPMPNFIMEGEDLTKFPHLYKAFSDHLSSVEKEDHGVIKKLLQALLPLSCSDEQMAGAVLTLSEMLPGTMSDVSKGEAHTNEAFVNWSKSLLTIGESTDLVETTTILVDTISSVLLPPAADPLPQESA